jgi:CheY-like chemotaxis protein
MISYVLGINTAGSQGENHFDGSRGNEILTSHSLSENKKHGASILLVEDNPVNRKMAGLMLTKAGYRIRMAENGQEAVDKYTQEPSAYDLILMDINMPVMNGFDATRRIREFESQSRSGERIPILALTANVLDDFKDQCKEVGMDAFLTKPIKRELVFRAINQWVK